MTQCLVVQSTKKDVQKKYWGGGGLISHPWGAPYSSVGGKPWRGGGNFGENVGRGGCLGGRGQGGSQNRTCQISGTKSRGRGRKGLKRQMLRKNRYSATRTEVGGMHCRGTKNVPLEGEFSFKNPWWLVGGERGWRRGRAMGILNKLRNVPERGLVHC